MELAGAAREGDFVIGDDRNTISVRRNDSIDESFLSYAAEFAAARMRRPVYGKLVRLAVRFHRKITERAKLWVAL